MTRRKIRTIAELPSGSPEVVQALQLRHLTSINDLRLDEIEAIFDRANYFLKKLRDSAVPHRIGKSTNLADGKVLATLFYEPSTRTRLSFESAMARLGGKSISSADPATSSAAKGESLADTVRVASNYADALVIRHPRDGAARFAAEFATVPVINGGDGSHEHPTQTLCDLFTLKREKKNLSRMNVAISGDLKGSRTIHSFVYALKRFGADITYLPAKGMELPEHVTWRLSHEFGRVPQQDSEMKDSSVDAIYVTGDQPHQLQLIAKAEIRIEVQDTARRGKKSIDAVYVTRFQKERWKEKEHDYPTVDANYLKGRRFARTRVMHPLPRVDELDIALDADPRAIYFQQAAYGVPIRMALMDLLLSSEPSSRFEQFPSGFRGPQHLVYDQPRNTGISCSNTNCIVHDNLDGKYSRNKFYLIQTNHPRLRCLYCETDIAKFVTTRRSGSSHRLLDASAALKGTPDIVFFKDDNEVRKANADVRNGHKAASG